MQGANILRKASAPEQKEEQVAPKPSPTTPLYPQTATNNKFKNVFYPAKLLFPVMGLVFNEHRKKICGSLLGKLPRGLGTWR